MITPRFLHRGDTVGIVAPGRKIAKQDIMPAVHILESWGLKVLLSPNLFANTHHYLSGTDAERCADLQCFLDDEEVAAIFCARGGYGSTRFLDQLEFKKFFTAPKWLIGFSDVTAIHLYLTKIGFESIHGIMPLLFAKDLQKTSVESLRKALFGESQPWKWSSNAGRMGKGSGIMVGGNLSLIVDSLGTANEIDTQNRILVLEEIEEYKYKIDRMLTQLKRARKLQQLAGLIIGHMTNILDSELSFGEDLAAIVFDKVKDLSFPIAFNFPSGHEMPNLAWRHGCMMTLEVSATDASLTPSPIL